MLYGQFDVDVISWSIPIGWLADRDRRGSDRHSEMIRPAF